MVLDARSASRRYFLVLAVAFLGGAFLRLHMLSEQILLDDEWHGVNAVVNTTYAEVLTQHNPFNHSSPLLNLYRLFLYDLLGWSEFGLRLPSVAAGLVGLIVLPLILRGILGKRVSLVFAFLLAVSPVLVFYSRFSRGYSAAMFFSFLGILSFCRWMAKGEHRHLAIFILAGAMAALSHPTTVVAMYALIGSGIGLRLLKRTRRSSTVRPRIAVSYRDLFTVAFAQTLLLAFLLLPTLLRFSKLPLAEGRMSASSVLAAASLISGTANTFLIAAFLLLAACGLLLMIKRIPTVGWPFLSIPVAYLVFFQIVRPMRIDAGIVIARYMIATVPIALASVAFAIDHCASRVETYSPPRSSVRLIPTLAFAGLLGLLVAYGPLPRIYIQPNNFTNHSAYQGSYEVFDWSQSDARHPIPGLIVSKEEIPEFYHWLGRQPNVRAILEYPFDVCNYNNLYYYYQHFHKKRCYIGYLPDKRIAGLTVERGDSGHGEASFRIGYLSLDQALYRVNDPGRLRFENMIDITDAGAIEESGAEFLVVHKQFKALKVTESGELGFVPVHYSSFPRLRSQYERKLGPPVFEDTEIACFCLKR